MFDRHAVLPGFATECVDAVAAAIGEGVVVYSIVCEEVDHRCGRAGWGVGRGVVSQGAWVLPGGQLALCIGGF